MEKPNGTIPILKWIWDNYLKTIFVPLVLSAIFFICVFFLSNAWNQYEMKSFSKSEVDKQLLQSASNGATVIEQQLNGLESVTIAYARQNFTALNTNSQISDEDLSRLAYNDDGIYYTTKDKKNGGAAIFYSGVMPINKEERDKVSRVLVTQDLMKDIQESNPLISSIYFNTFDSLNIIYPYFDVLPQYTPHMDIPTFNFYYEADEAHNPERGAKWTDVYLDPAGHGWMASCIVPVYTGDFLEGVVGTDITVGTITEQVLNMKIPWEGYCILAGKDGTILALPAKGEKDWGLSELTNHTYEEAIKQDTFKPEQFNLYNRDNINAFTKNLKFYTAGSAKMTLNGEDKMVSWDTISETGWKLIIIVPEENIYAHLKSLGAQLNKIGFLIIGLLLLFLSVIVWIQLKNSRNLSSNIAQPLLTINDIVRKIGMGEFYQEQPNVKFTEISETAQLIIGMGQELGETNEKLLKTQERLQGNEAYLQALLRSIDDVVLEIDETGNIKNVRTSDSENLAVDFSQDSQQTIYDIMEQDKALQYMNVIKNVIKSGNPETIEYELQTPKGLRWFQARIALILDNSRTVAVSARDITEQKELAASVVIARDEAEKSSLAKSQFLSNMSHELRTPLNAVLGFAQVLEMNPAEPLSESQAECVQEIEKAGYHLLQLINEILDLAKIESGKTTISIEPLQVSLIMEEALAMISPMASKYNININTKFADPKMYALGDRMRIKQVLINLLSNAIKYNKENGSIDFYCEQNADSIRFHVVDTGIGISKQDLQLIFKPFHRANIIKNSVEGTGIGLTMVKELMELMGGLTYVESNVGEGSHFYVELPVSKEINIKEKGKYSEENNINDFSLIKDKKVILYIEDNPANLNLVERLLERIDNTKLLAAPSGELGVELALANIPDLILLDINLAGMDGYETFKRFQSFESLEHIPVIAVSSNAMDKDIVHAINIGFADYIIKPINANDFIYKIINILK